MGKPKLEREKAGKGNKNEKMKKKCQNVKKSSQKYKLQREKATARNRKYKANLSQEKKAIIRAKARERYHKKKELGIIKPISEKSEREQRGQRKRWKEATKKYRRNKQMAETTPEANSLQVCHSATSRKISGRKKIAKSRSKVYRELKKKEQENEKLRKKVYKYKQRWLRLKQDSTTPITPRRKIKSLLKGQHVSETVRKKLYFGEVLSDQLKENLRAKCSSQKEKQLFHKVICGKILKKYRVLNMARDFLSRRKTNKSFDCEKLNCERKKRNHSISDYLQKEIRAVFEDDQNSRMCPSKRDYVTRSNEKVQKRILLKSIKDIHHNFIAKKNISISYTTFCRMKPFWIVPPKMRERETCACIKHENIQFLTCKLYNLKVIEEKKPDYLFGKNLDDLKINRDPKEVISYDAWETVKEKKNIKGKLKTITKTAKVKKSCTFEELIETLKIALPLYENHVRIMVHQAKALKEIKNSLKSNEILFHVDFSENYELKLFKEVQSMHFGASKKQLSLHTVVMYSIHENELNAKSYCTVSEDLAHQAHAIWAHLVAIFEKIEKAHVEKVHFFSDGPSGQYRNRYNIYLLVKVIQNFFPKVTEVTWNFSCSGHGKGPMDGIGGTLKRMADSFVLHGGDVHSAETFVEIFKYSKIKVILITPDKIENMKTQLPDKVVEIPQITKLHQIKWSWKLNKIFPRVLTCWECPSDCHHFSDGNKALKIADSSNDMDRETDNENLMPDDWVAVVFSDNWYPGIIEKISGNILRVSFMTVAGCNKFSWPEKEDVHDILAQHILCKIQKPPEPVSARHFSLDRDDVIKIQSTFAEFNSGHN